MEKVQLILEALQRFEAGEIKLTLLSTPLRSGSVLLHSLLDNHPQILQIPSIFWFFCDWEYSGCQNLPPEAKAPYFFEKSFRIPQKVQQLGQNQETNFDLKLEEVVACLQQTLPYIPQVDRKTFLLVFHFAYAAVHQINLKTVKVLLLHHHLLPNLFGYFTYLIAREEQMEGPDLEPLLACTPEQYKTTGDQILNSIVQDFPGCQFLVTIRNPYAGLYSSEKVLLEGARQVPYRVDLAQLHVMTYNILLLYYSVHGMQQYLPPSSMHLVKFEEIHSQTEQTMRDVAMFLGIDFVPSLLETTFAGYPWMGVGTTRNRKRFLGTDPKIAEQDTEWLTGWDELERSRYAPWLNPLAQCFGYPVYEPKRTDINLFEFTPLEQQCYLQYPHFLTDQFSQYMSRLSPYVQNPASPDPVVPVLCHQQTELFGQKMDFWLNYPTLRAKTLEALNSISREKTVIK